MARYHERVLSQGRIIFAGQLMDESHKSINSYDIMYSNENECLDAREIIKKKRLIKPSAKYLRASYTSLSNHG